MPDKMSAHGKRRLLLITLSDLPQTPYFELALPALIRDGWDVTIIGPGATSALLKRVLPYPARTKDMLTGGVLPLRELRYLRHLIGARVGRYDVIYVQSAALGPRAMCAFLGPLFRTRLVYQTLDYLDPLQHPFLVALERRLARKAHAVLNGEYHRAYICKSYYKLERSMLIVPPNLPAAWPVPAQDRSIRSQLAGGQSDAFVLMLHGGFTNLRMVRELFAALALLPSRFRLVMTSSGSREPEAEKLLREFQIDNRVVRLGRVAFDEMLRYTVNADAGVLLYQNTDLGNYFQAPGRITEYLACGLPVIATNHVGLEALIRRHEIGEVVDSRNPRQIADALLELERRRQCGEMNSSRMRAVFLDHFAFEHYEQRVCHLFNTILENEPVPLDFREALI